MTKEQRLLYLELSKEINGSICGFCKFGKWYSEGCCEGYNECSHPIQNITFVGIHQQDCEPGDDCFAFRPIISSSMAADITGIVLEAGWDEWFYRIKSDNILVCGRSYDAEGEHTSKVYIAK